MRNAVNPTTVWPPFGAHSMAVIEPEGRTIHLGGQVAYDKSRNLVGKNDLRAQTRQTLHNIEQVLDSMGGTLDDVVSITTYVTDMEGLRDIHEVRQEVFREPYPASTLVRIAGFIEPAILVEITAVAVIPTERFTAPESRGNPYFASTESGYSLG